jgi:hypothetical protein
VEVALTQPHTPLDGRLLAPWWQGTAPAALTPEWLRLDPWRATPRELAQALGNPPAGSGVLLRLDQHAPLLGLHDAQRYRQLQALLLAIEQAHAMPILVLDATFDIRPPSAQSTAMTWQRLSRTFNCPFLDLRNRAP